MRRRNKIVIAILSLVAGFFYLDLIVPIHKARYREEKCKFCGVQKSEETFHLWAFRVRREVAGPTRTHETELYDRYIAEPHQHQWLEVIDNKSKWNVFDHRAHHRAHLDWVVDRHSLHRHELLLAMESFEDEPVEFRREVYRDLIDCKDKMDYDQVRQLLQNMSANPEGARELYEMYKQN